jgi:hypothetical protein
MPKSLGVSNSGIKTVSPWRFCLGAFVWLVGLALGTSVVGAKTPSSGGPLKPAPLLEFVQYQEAVRAAFQLAATVRMPGASDVAAVAAFAELAYVESSEPERDELIKALQKAAEGASDPASRGLARAWLLQFRALALLENALTTLSKSSALKHPLGGSVQARNSVLPEARNAVEQAKAAIRQISKAADRSVLETANIAAAAFIDVMDHRDHQALEKLWPLWSRPPSSAREVPFWLVAPVIENDGNS